MSDPVTAALSVGGSILGGVMQSDAASDASSAQMAAADKANQTQLQMFNQIRSDLMPYSSIGASAMGALAQAFGLGTYTPSNQASYQPTTFQQMTAPVAGPIAAQPASQMQPSNGVILGSNAKGQPIINWPAPISNSASPAAARDWVNSVNATLAKVMNDPNISNDQKGKALNQAMQIKSSPSSILNSSPIPTVANSPNYTPAVVAPQQQVAAPQTGSFTPSAGGIPGLKFGTQFDNNNLKAKFTNADLNEFLAPNYAFQLQQGQQALQNSQAAQNGVLSGAALKDMQKFVQGTAAGAYQDAFSNWMNTQNMNYNQWANTQNMNFSQLASLAGLGQNAAAQTGNAGVQTGQSLANNMIGSANAQAAGIIGGQNAINQGIGSGLGFLNLSQLAGGGGGGLSKFLSDYSDLMKPNSIW
jgi:hypothetical protein